MNWVKLLCLIRLRFRIFLAIVAIAAIREKLRYSIFCTASRAGYRVYHHRSDGPGLYEFYRYQTVIFRHELDLIA